MNKNRRFITSPNYLKPLEGNYFPLCSLLKYLGYYSAVDLDHDNTFNELKV